MEVVFERVVLKSGLVGYKMLSEGEDFEKLRKIVNRITAKEGDGYFNVKKLSMHISEKEKDGQRYFLAYKEVGDVTEDDLNELIELLKDAKREIEEKEIIKVCI